MTEKAERHGRHQHVGVGPEQDGELVPGPDRRLLGVADRDEHGMAAEKDDGPGAEAAVPAHEAVLAEDAFQQGEPRYEQEHDEQQVTARQAGDLAGRGLDPARCRQRSPGHGRQPERERDTEPDQMPRR